MNEPPDAVDVGSRCDLAAVGLADAASATYRPPDGCAAHAPTAAPIRDESAFRAAFSCTAPSGLDFARDELHVVVRPLSPASVGVEVFDDGSTVTLVTLQRAPCEGELPPMPVDVSVAYVVPAEASRGTAEVACRVAVPCE